MNKKVNIQVLDVFTELFHCTNKISIALRGDLGRAVIRKQNLFTLQRIKVLS